MFDATCSPLKRDQTLLAQYRTMLKAALPEQTRIAGILEIGSFAKGEAVPCSDVDTRVYVTSPKQYSFNVFGQIDYPKIEPFVKVYGSLPIKTYDWETFNDSLCIQLSKNLGCQIEFGFVDQRYANFELDNLAHTPSIEHGLLLQSQILYDPDRFLAQKREQIMGKVYPAMSVFYQQQYLDQLYQRIYDGLNPSSWDAYKLDKSGQIIWVQRAVRCLRNAVAAKTYIETGHSIYIKNEVLGFYRRYLPKDYEFVQMIYDWKTVWSVREKMVRGFRQDPEPFFARFRACMPQLETIVAKVRELS